MSYAILQHQCSLIPVAALAKAFQSVDRLTDGDATIIAREAFGIVVEDLNQSDAQQIAGSLNSQGIGVEIVEGDELFSMPPPKKLKRCDCLPDQLNLYDALGRPKSIGWEHVVLMAAGPVSTVEFANESQFVRDIDGALAVETQTREIDNVRFYIELLLDVEPSRYQIDATTFLFQYLGQRVTQNRLHNYFLLVQDLVSYATSALINYGATSMISQKETTMHYGSRRMFEREIIWMIWNGLRSSQAQID